jgi:hypothetical protein
MNKLRLLKVFVQPVFVVDDGETLSEMQAEPVVVHAEDWPAYATTQFREAVNALQAELDASAGSNGARHRSETRSRQRG